MDCAKAAELDDINGTANLKSWETGAGTWARPENGGADDRWQRSSLDDSKWQAQWIKLLQQCRWLMKQIVSVRMELCWCFCWYSSGASGQLSLLRSLQASSAQLCSAIKGTGRDPFPPIKWGTKKQLSKTGINKIVGIPLLYIRLSIGTRKINHHFKVISLGLPTEESTHCDQWTRHLMSHLSKGNRYIIE